METSAKSVKVAQGVRIGILGGALLGLVACSEPEVILVGKRENPRSILQGYVVQNGGTQTNESRVIALPTARVNADWPQSIGTPATRAAHPSLAAAPALIWSADIGAGDSRKARITANPVVQGGRIFTLDAGALVSATSESGARLWQVDVKPARGNDGEATGGGLAVSGDTVFVSHGFGVLVALDATSGAEKWRQMLGATGSGAPSVYEGLVYVTAGDDTGYALDAKTGRIVWETSAPENVHNVLGAPAPAITEDFAIFGFGSGDVQAIFRRGGLRRWGTAVVGERIGSALAKVGDVTGAPVVFGQTIYVGNQAGRLVALDLASGDRIWTALEGTIGPVLPLGNSVFAVSDRNALIRFDAETGAQIWSKELPNFVKDRPRKRAEVFVNYGPILAGGRIYVASSDGVLRGFDPKDGALVAQIDIPGGATTAPVVAGGVLYVVSAKGVLHALR